MPTDLALFVLSIGFAGLVGYAAAHGGICAVRAVEDLLDGRGGALFLAFLKCSVWVAATTMPLAWAAVPGGHFAVGYPFAWPVAAGGFLFGVGAALNGGCAFSTVTHLGAGDLNQVFALLGLGLGFALHVVWTGPLVPPAAPRPGPLAPPETWSLALLAAAWVWAAREIVRLLRRPATPGARADRTMAVIALAGGALYLLHGPWMYTAGLPDAALAYAALVAGAACALLLLRALRGWEAFFRDHGQADPRPAMRKLPGAATGRRRRAGRCQAAVPHPSSQPALTGPAPLARP